MRIDFEPIGRRVDAAPGQTLLSAAQAAGIELVAVCGGGGTCGTCRVRLVQGQLSPPGPEEESLLTPAERETGLRLACQAVPFSDVRLEIPPQSLAAPQRTQVEGQETPVEVDPGVTALSLRIDAPGPGDLRADDARLRDTLAAAGFSQAALPLPVVSALPEMLRARAGALTCAINRAAQPAQVTSLHAPGARLCGLAVDVGTTKLAAYLVDLGDGRTLARLGAMNPQIAYGEDVIARIAYCDRHPGGRALLQSRLVETLNEMLAQLCRAADVDARNVAAAVVVGNTAMHHLFAGIPVAQLGAAPYIPAVAGALEFPAALVGLALPPSAPVYLPPNIAGYVGADHVAMLLATGAAAMSGNVLAMDIGTNTEITLNAGGRLLACSCASGPAFEGAHISHGMRAAPGAIERVQIRDGTVRVHTIGNQPPVGLCGSGILDAVAEMLSAGILDARGSLDRSAPGVREHGRRAAYTLIPAAQSGSGQEIRISRDDVHQIQLAKAAIRAGTDILLHEAGLSAAGLDAFLIAGAFGAYIDVQNAVRTGMFPDLPPEKFRQVGNAAGSGARQLLLSRAARQEAQALVSREEYIELTTYPGFTDRFVEAMFFKPLANR